MTHLHPHSPPPRTNTQSQLYTHPRYPATTLRCSRWPTLSLPWRSVNELAPLCNFRVRILSMLGPAPGTIRSTYRDLCAV
ncbi:hypothetical protein BGW80DRAFT_1387561 [Lactifluus volemus]|nr:hypothetical protein BGW80DRAFT_1387561 [Lactifluus volemus]